MERIIKKTFLSKKYIWLARIVVVLASYFYYECAQTQTTTQTTLDVNEDSTSTHNHQKIELSPIPSCKENNIDLHFEDPEYATKTDYDVICKKIHSKRKSLNSHLKINNNKIFKIVISHKTSAPFSITEWSEAMTIDGIVHIPVSVFSKSGYIKIIYHEIVHAYIYSLIEDRAATWIEEGLAQVLSKEKDPASTNHKKLISTKRSLLGALHIRSLRQGFENLNISDARIAYDKSYAATRYLLKSHSLSDFGEYLKKISYGYTHERAFISVFGITEDDLEKKLELY